MTPISTVISVMSELSFVRTGSMKRAGIAGLRRSRLERDGTTRCELGGSPPSNLDAREYAVERERTRDAIVDRRVAPGAIGGSPGGGESLELGQLRRGAGDASVPRQRLGREIAD